MRRRLLYCAGLLAVLVAACTKEPMPDKAGKSDGAVLSADTTGCVLGMKIVKFDRDFTDLIAADVAEGKLVTKSMGLNQALDELGIVSLRRLFSDDDGEYAERHRSFGLDQWYVVEFDKSVPLTKAGEEFSAIDGVEIVENQHKIVSMAYFNDPRAGEQWGYYNHYSSSTYKDGADINVVPVWRDYTTGSSKVIVGVVDGGIDIDHPDLEANCIAGGSDGSKNFVDNNFNIVAHSHGTHVAGTIAAVNNNKLGVSGVAGGDYANNVAGVRMLSCQIFKTVNGKDQGGSSSEAIRWACDHGAVITNNSWGYSVDQDGDGSISTSELEYAKNLTIGTADKAAIDYFIKYAGCDNSGNQKSDSPMKGGVVIFAAGNDAIQYGQPASYDAVIAVGAIGADGRRASYSNYGDWVDICAPGGSQSSAMILSTLPMNTGYGTMQGTSMACPHVSGVAALIVSYYGGQGFTNEMLKERLLGGVNTSIVSSASKIGGLVDALGAMTYGSSDVPGEASISSVDVKSNVATVNWKHTGDDDNRIAYGYLIIAGKDQSAVAKADPKNLASGLVSKAVSTESGAKVGDAVSAALEGLDFETTYYVAVFARDYSMNYSGVSNVVSFTTSANNAPVINATPHAADTSLASFAKAEIPMTISDPDGHAVTVKLSGDTKAVALNQGVTDGAYTLVVDASVMEAGAYSVTITATDTYKAATDFVYKYTVRENQAPQKVKDFDNVLTNLVGYTFNYETSDYIVDPDGETPTFTFSMDNNNVVHVRQSGTKLVATTLGYGLATVTVTATDVKGATETASFKVLVRKEGVTVEAYPNPVSKILYVRTTEEDSESSVKLVSSTGTTVYDETKTFSAFDPLAIDVTKLAPGRYSLKVVNNGVTTTKDIVKK